MARGRTDGMTVIAVFHFVLGALGVVAAALSIAVGVSLLLPATAHATDALHLTFSSRAHAYATGFILDGVARFALNVLLIVAGIRVLDVAPAGRRLSILASMAWTLLNVVELYAFGWSIWIFFVAMLYPMAVETVFLKREWREAFSGEMAALSSS
jgi:hypothetical protein